MKGANDEPPLSVIALIWALGFVLAWVALCGLAYWIESL